MLGQAIESVLEQEYPHTEIIIVDDGSTDDTGATIKTFQIKFSDKIFSIKHQKARGPGVARQAGLNMARGEFVQYLDSDDLLLADKFTAQVGLLDSDDSIDVVYGWTKYQFKNGDYHPEPWKGSGVKQTSMFPAFVTSRWWDTPNPLYRKSICDRVGPWLELWQEEDWEYDCRIAGMSRGLGYVEDYVCIVRDHENQRLGSQMLDSKEKLRSSATARRKIHGHAILAGVNQSGVEFQHFLRGAFLLSRQCGAAGLIEESKVLFALAEPGENQKLKQRWGYHVYKALAQLFGWERVGKWAIRSDHFK